MYIYILNPTTNKENFKLFSLNNLKNLCLSRVYQIQLFINRNLLNSQKRMNFAHITLIEVTNI